MLLRLINIIFLSRNYEYPAQASVLGDRKKSNPTLLRTLIPDAFAYRLAAFFIVDLL